MGSLVVRDKQHFAELLTRWFEEQFANNLTYMARELAKKSDIGLHSARNGLRKWMNGAIPRSENQGRINRFRAALGLPIYEFPSSHLRLPEAAPETTASELPADVAPRPIPVENLARASDLSSEAQRLLSSLPADLLKVPGASVFSRVLKNGETLESDRFEQFHQALDQLLTVKDKVLEDIAGGYGVSYDVVARDVLASRIRTLREIEDRFRSSCDVERLGLLRDEMLELLKPLRKGGREDTRLSFVLDSLEETSPRIAAFAEAFERLQAALKQPFLKQPFRAPIEPIRLARHAKVLIQLKESSNNLDPLSAIGERLSTCERKWLEALSLEQRRKEAERAIGQEEWRAKLRLSRNASPIKPDHWERHHL